MDAPLPSVPRTGLEWAHVFRQADRVAEFSVTTVNGDKPVIRPGVCVSLKPDGSRRNDASNPDAELFARVVATAIHWKYGKLVRLRWFITQEEFTADKCANIFTEAIVPTIGDMELIQLAHETHQFADRIDRKISIVSFSPHRLSLPVIDDKTYYTRVNLAVDWAWEPYFLSIASPIDQEICYDECLSRNQFDINEDPIMRYCERCERWYHEQCIVPSPSGDVALLDIKPTRPPQPEDAHEANELFQRGEIDFTGYQYTTWTTLLRRPIQRGHVGYPWLLSFELLLHAVRAHDRAWGCPSDVQDFVTQHLSMAPSLVHLTDKFRASVQNGTTFIIYICPGCEQNI
ncbi:hypothetical protein FKP32DRAFT_1671927 [Trametes sanguinea]|nr:hypothetical protein FKP32DRAFT_1671927 [Trametes sanguinea]